MMISQGVIEKLPSGLNVSLAISAPNRNNNLFIPDDRENGLVHEPRDKKNGRNPEGWMDANESRTSSDLR